MIEALLSLIGGGGGLLTGAVAAIAAILAGVLGRKLGKAQGRRQGRREAIEGGKQKDRDNADEIKRRADGARGDGVRADDITYRD